MMKPGLPSRPPRRAGGLAPAPVTPLDCREVDHAKTHKHEQGNGDAPQQLGGADGVIGHSDEGDGADQKLMLPSPCRPHTTMAIEKLNRAARDAQPTVINMV